MIVRTGSGLLAIVLLLVALGMGVLYSTAGNRYIVRLAEEALTPALSVRGVDGSLLTTLCAEEFVFQNSSIRVEVDELCLSPRLWDSFDFLSLQVGRLEAAAVRILTLDGAGEGSAEPIGLPVAIAVDDLQVGRLEVNEVALTAVDAVLELSNSDLALEGKFRYQDDEVSLTTSGPWTHFRVDVEAFNARADAQLNLHANDLPWSVEATSSQFDLLPFTDRQMTLADISLTGAGNLRDYEFDLDGLVRDAAVHGRVSAAGSGDWAGLVLERLVLAEVQLAELPVAVDRLSGRGRLSWGDGFSAEFEDISAAGTVLDRPLNIDLAGILLTPSDVTMAAGVVRLTEDAQVRLRVDGTAQFDGELELSVDGEAIPLKMIDERLDGRARLSTRVGGSIAAPELEGDFALKVLGWDGRVIGDVDGRLTGSQDAGTLSASVVAAAAKAEADVSYTLVDGKLILVVQNLSLAATDIQSSAALEQPTTVVLGAGGVSFEHSCFVLQTDLLEVEAGRICVELDYPDGALTLRLDPWRVRPMPLPDTQIAVSGVAALAVKIAQFSPLSGELELQLGELVAHHQDMAPVQLGALSVTAEVADSVAVLELQTPENEAQNLRMEGTVTSALASELSASTLSGDLQVQIDGIWVAETLLPMDVAFELSDIAGLMAVKTEFAGTLGEPVVNGSLTLTDAGWQVLAVNSTFSDFDLDATLHESDRISFISEGAIGDGRLNFTGEILGLAAGEPRLNARFEMDDAGVLNLPDYQAILDGDVSLEMGASDLTLRGAIRMPRASILIADLPETAVSVSADEVIVDAEVSGTAQQIRTTDLELTLGDDVRLEAFGLTARLSGHLRLVEAPGRLRSVTGVINLREGVFEAYGQALEVERGQLTFTGQVDDPTVDVVATRLVPYNERDYRISLLISGTAKNLQTTVRSQPTLSEDDALALLITGQTFSQISSSEQTNVYGAALSLGLLSTSGLKRNLASVLQLEEIILDQDSQGNMEVGAAVRLNRDFYLRYTYGAFSRIGGVLLRYRLNKRISVQAVTGDAHSIEIRYGVDE